MSDGLDNDWTTPAGELVLADDSLHIWRARVDRLPAESGLEATLSVSERTRAGKYRVPRDQIRFRYRRAILRDVLSRYTGIEPENLQFSRNEYGKPRLLDTGIAEKLSFSTSHSAGTAVVCVARSAAVGIDIEERAGKALPDNEARTVLTPKELDVLSSVSDAARRDAFLAFWTCKEAIVKAIGIGLSLPLDQIEVSGIDGPRPQVQSIAEEHGPQGQWHLMRFVPSPEFIGAAAVKGKPIRLRTWTWNGSQASLGKTSVRACNSRASGAT